MITRRYSPPFQTPAPKPGAEDMGTAVKGLVNVEITRSSEVSFALESFGCDGKPVLSLLRGLPCEGSGTLVVAGKKNGMPFKLNSDLPRGIGSAIRGSGGGLRQVSAGTAMRTQEWVLYDNVGNYWSLDELTSGRPTYRGQTPPLNGGDGLTPALCVQAPGIRPYELRWEYVEGAGDPVHYAAKYLWGGAGWQDDAESSPVISSPVAYPYALPSEYWRIEQWIPDETTPPAGGENAAAWPDSLRNVDCLWYPGVPDQPHDWDATTENSVDVIVSKYPAEAPWRVHMNQFTRPLVEHISTGGAAAEQPFVIAIEHCLHPSSAYRIVLRSKGAGTLLAQITSAPPVTTSAKVVFTPDKGEGWLQQPGTFTGTSTKVSILRRIRSRVDSAHDYGSALVYVEPVNVWLPPTRVYAWSDPVWFRVGRISTFFGSAPRLTPLLPRWR